MSRFIKLKLLCSSLFSEELVRLAGPTQDSSARF